MGDEQSEKQPLDDNRNDDINIELEDAASENHGEEESELLSQLYFSDGVSSIDFVLVYSKSDINDSMKEKQEFFLNDLASEGLTFETDDEEGRNEVYVKVHAPFDTLARYAEIMKIRKPMKQSLFEGSPSSLFPRKKDSTLKSLARCADFMKMFHHKDDVIPKIERQFSWPFSQDKQYLFAIPEDREKFFNAAERSMIVDYIMRRARYTDMPGMFGVAKLLQDGVYCGAYPLHEGDVLPTSSWNTRRLLYETWAHPRNCLKHQPLDQIRLYFGEKIALYFAWLGFYTFWLIPASIVGVIVLVYGIVAMATDTVVLDVCNSNITMCPLCYHKCPFWSLSDSCNMARLGRVVDNGLTVFFAIFMAFWCTLFLEMWKRHQYNLAYEWSVFDFEREEAPPRPEFMSLLDTKHFKTKVNILSGKEEPFIPFWRHRFPVTFFSFTSVVILVMLAIGFVIGVIVYRVSVYTTMKTRNEAFLHKSASMISSATAASLNLIVIIILNVVYNRLAIWLTNKEQHRTQPDYEDSLTLKLYLLKFVNFYSSIFYIAFFKGRLFSSKNRFSEQCQAGGCLIELCVQMIIIMVGKQVINFFTENVVPRIRQFLFNMFKECRQAKPEGVEDNAPLSRWEADLKLDDQGPRPLFFEYLEMMIQFGFMTIFVTAFPLAPLFALLNNILEIRGDAYKFVMTIRRPVARRARTIGVWQTILVSITRLAVLTNAAIIALTADFIPRYVYVDDYSPTKDLRGYINFTLSYHNSSDFQPGEATKTNETYCRYRQYRNPPWAENPGQFSSIYWQILSAQFIFIVVFENVVIFVTALVAWLIPDVSSRLKATMIREVCLTNEIILKAELRRKDNRPAVNLTDVMNQVRRRPPKVPDVNGEEAVA